MKKTITLLALLFCLSAKSQCGPGYTIGVQSPEDTLNIGDSTHVYLAYNYGMQGATVVNIYFTNNLYLIYSGTLQHLDSIQHITYNSYNCAVIGFKIPVGCPLARQTIHYCGQILGHLYITNNIGITPYDHAQAPVLTEYFNLMGQPINEPDGLTIEINTYLDGKKSVRKIVKSWD